MKNRVPTIGLTLAILLGSTAFGADTSTPPKDPFTPQQRKFWAFQSVKRPQVPQAAANPIDAFIQAKMQSDGLKPNPSADRITLLRRVTFDLAGLPPPPAEVDAFVNDKSPNAFNQVVDLLLASPQYGERWARHWLDLARYAESERFKSDGTRPNAWR